MKVSSRFLRRDMRGMRAACAVLLTGVLLAGCATGPNAHPRDPMEPWNRRVYRFNDALDKGVAKPVATAYTKVTPKFVRKGVSNFFSNLGDAWSTVNSVLQLKGKDAVNNFFRFTVNTVFGFGGVLDIATEAQIPQSKQDFGSTLGRWGVPAGPYVVLPILGPSSVRDTAALPVDFYGNPVRPLDPVSARNALTALSFVNRRAELLDASDLLDRAALDPYAFMRDAYLQRRDAQTGQSARYAGSSADGRVEDDDGYEPPPDEDDDTSAAETNTAAGADAANAKTVTTSAEDAGTSAPNEASEAKAKSETQTQAAVETSVGAPETKNVAEEPLQEGVRSALNAQMPESVQAHGVMDAALETPNKLAFEAGSAQ